MTELVSVKDIRLADEHDEFEIFKLCSLMHSEQPYHPLSWDKIVPMIRLATARTRGIIGVIGERHDLKAAIFLVLEPIWYSDDWHLLEFFNYVREDARRSELRPPAHSLRQDLRRQPRRRSHRRRLLQHQDRGEVSPVRSSYAEDGRVLLLLAAAADRSDAAGLARGERTARPCSRGGVVDGPEGQPDHQLAIFVEPAAAGDG